MDDLEIRFEELAIRLSRNVTDYIEERKEAQVQDDLERVTAREDHRKHTVIVEKYLETFIELVRNIAERK